ncbi:serine/threonine protein kinase [Actinoplanes cyaneus]|uniref:non-specific serine/threonine protein kinase n=1 Tax=Actinoplanes cyaneus TaxID=52696 RepID=A0A919IND8_9ACTN|nr:serine/threonine-protein kinase [Actinoplanes cyaneus]MCW2140881.1 serine/threonine protein kinase [Actinoplanes cyaneus]GID69134.1 serine/threonine protein kinase [Actinoplanes cyaneus]
MLSPGIVLNNRYQLTQRIAAGGMGEVWRGGDLLLHREVAVKVLLPALMNDREFITRFRSEARMMAQLRHPGIVQVYDYGENAVVNGDGFDYLVMEFIEGISLSQKIQQAGRLSPAETMQIVAGMADALHTAHQSGIIHRDVKPGNLLVRPGGALVLVDFGIARSVGVTSMTGTNVVLGSVNYMAPEQAEGKPVTAATDVYALGAVAFACLTGRPPYVGDNPLAVLGQLVHGQPPVLPPDVPRGVASVVLRALAKDPAQRFPSGAALADAARNALRAPAAAPFPPTQQHQQQPGNRGTQQHQQPPGNWGTQQQPGNWGTQTGRRQPEPQGYPTYAAAAARPVSPSPVPAAYEPPLPSAGEEPPRKRNAGLVAAAAGLILVGGGVLWAVTHDTADQADASSASLEQVQTPTKPVPASSTRKGGKTGGQKATPTKPTKQPDLDEGDVELPDEDGQSAAPPQAEEVNKYKPAKVCGDGFEVLDSQNLKSPAGVVQGRVYFLYRGSDKSNCVVTLRTTGLAGKGAASAFVEPQGQPRKAQAGDVQYYAGPVTVAAPGTCVKWGGSVGDQAFESDFEHCD